MRRIPSSLLNSSLLLRVCVCKLSHMAVVPAKRARLNRARASRDPVIHGRREMPRTALITSFRLSLAGRSPASLGRNDTIESQSSARTAADLRAPRLRARRTPPSPRQECRRHLQTRGRALYSAPPGGPVMPSQGKRSMISKSGHGVEQREPQGSSSMGTEPRLGHERTAHGEHLLLAARERACRLRFGARRAAETPRTPARD